MKHRSVRSMLRYVFGGVDVEVEVEVEVVDDVGGAWTY